MFKGIFKGKKVLITGHTGFKGSWLTTWLLKLGAHVYGVSKDIPTNPSMFEELELEHKIKHYQEDVRDLAKLNYLVSEIKPDFVFHLAAQAIVSTSYSDPIETITTNVLGTANILESLRTSNNECIAIIITSDKCYDNVEWVWGYKESDRLGGKDIYSGSKSAAELVFKSYYHSFFNEEGSNVKVASARAGNVIGGGDWAQDRIVPDCMRAWSKDQVVEIRNPDATRPWQHVLEPLSGYLCLAQQLYENPNLNGESFNFGPNAQYNNTVTKLLKDLSILWKFTDPEKAFKVTEHIKFHEAGLLKLNCDKALYYLDWIASLSYRQLIKFTGEWYYNFYKKEDSCYKITMNQISEYEQTSFIKKIKWAIQE